MTTETDLPQAIFPDMPRQKPVIAQDGNFNNYWLIAINNLFQALQQNFSNQGIKLPPLNATQIANIQAVYAPFIGMPLPSNPPVQDISGFTIFDTTNRVPKVFIITYDGATPPNVLTAAWLTYVLI